MFSNLAMWNGAKWTSMGEVTGTVRALALLGEHLYVGGDFESAGRLSVKYFARQHLGSGVWSEAMGTSPSLDSAHVSRSPFNAPVMTLRPLGTCMYVGGAFTAPQHYVTRYCVGSDTFDQVQGAHELGPVNVLAAPSEASEAALLKAQARPLYFLCLLNSQTPGWSAAARRAG